MADVVVDEDRLVLRRIELLERRLCLGDMRLERVEVVALDGLSLDDDVREPPEKLGMEQLCTGMLAAASGDI